MNGMVTGTFGPENWPLPPPPSLAAAPPPCALRLGVVLSASSATVSISVSVATKPAVVSVWISADRTSCPSQYGGRRWEKGAQEAAGAVQSGTETLMRASERATTTVLLAKKKGLEEPYGGNARQHGERRERGDERAHPARPRGRLRRGLG